MQTQVNAMPRLSQTQTRSLRDRIWRVCLHGLLWHCVFLYGALHVSVRATETIDTQFPLPSVSVVEHTAPDNTTYVAVEASIYVQGSPAQFLALLEEADRDCSWLANCAKVTILSDAMANQRIVHTVLSSPWPLQDREMITRSVHHISADGTHFDMRVEDVSADYPPHPQRILMRDVSARWQMIPVTESWYKLHYTSRAHPGGLIPDWVAKVGIEDATITTLTNIQEHLHALHLHAHTSPPPSP